MTSGDRSCLFALANATAAPAATQAAARAAGLDPYRLAMLLRARGLVALASGDAENLEQASRELSQAGLRCAVVPVSEARSLAPPQVASGIASDGDSVTPRVHGRPFGPPTGAPLLMLFADLAPAEPLPSAEHPGDSLSQCVSRAVCPVVDLIWREGRLRLAPQAISWLGFPGASPSSKGNFVRLLELLTARSGGVTADLHFDGREMLIEPAQTAIDPIEGASRQRLALFERFSTAAALAWNRGLYPAAVAGQMTLVGESPAGTAAPAAAVAVPAAMPWVREHKASQLRYGLAPLVLLVPVYVATLLPDPRATAATLAICGVISVAIAITGLRLRERLRAVPLAPVRSLAMGPVGLTGRVEGCARLRAPYSLTPCVWYHFELQELEENGKHQLIASGGCGDLPFRLNDGTGEVLVQPAGAEIDVEPQATWLDDNQRAREWILEEGEEVYVAGVAQRRSSLEDEHRLLAQRLAAVKHDPAVLARLGAAADAGQAWDQVRADVEREVLTELSARASDSDDVFIGSAPGQPFLIASRSQKQQTQRLTLQFVTGAVFGVALLTAALALWLRA